ncbi:MAG: phage tail tip lysozyme [Streptococcus hyointestinalis]|nr:phage tail tip lysozyme [Streptococcus hyointestinalis]MDD6383846.1 phage tail tip lysozyme [Streptococcus hyointestinalis]
MVTAVGKLVRTVGNTKSRVIQTSRQRRGGVTDLAGIDYVAEIRNDAGTISSTTSSTSGIISGDTSTWEGRVAIVAKAVKQSLPTATVNGIAGMVGCFTIESNLESKRAEGDFLPAPIGASDSSWDDDSWLNMSGPQIYNGGYPNVVHRGLGLGQWTDTRDGADRHTRLLNFAKANGVKWYDLGLQIKFIFEGDNPYYIEIAKRLLTSNTDVTNATANFLAQWEGVPGNKLGERIAKAQQAVPIIEKALKEAEEKPSESASTNASQGQSPSASESTSLSTSEGSASNSDSSNTSESESIDNSASSNTTRTSTKVSPIAYFPITISQDLDRFQKWYFKIIAEELDTDKNQEGNVPLADVQIAVLARNTAEGAQGKVVEIDLTNILKKQHPCNWVGNSSGTPATYPNALPEDGFDLMKAAWDLSDEQRKALFSSGQKTFFMKAIGNHKITFRNFMKFSHIN